MAGRRRSETFFKRFLGLSALAHLNFVLLLSVVLSIYPEACSSDQLDITPFEVSLVSPDEALALEPELDKLKEELEEEEKEEVKKEQDEKGQVVELAPPPEEKRPDRARFLSEFDSSVKKETKGKPEQFKAGNIRASRPLPRVKPSQQEPRPPPTAVLPQKVPKEPQEQKEPSKEMKLAMRPRTPDMPASELPDSKTGDAPAKVDPPGPERIIGPPVPRQQAVQGPDRPTTLRELSMKELSQALGSKVNDYLPDVEDGKTTLLNSRRWRFATFFNRVKRRVAQKWHPARVYRRRDPGGNVYGFKDRLTILRVRLTPGGDVKEVHLENPSGVGFLDDEAISAFRAAGPFPNPPRGLVKDDAISFRFGFMFEISRKPSFRIFRQ